MARIVTALKRQKRRQSRVSVFLDEEYAFSLEEIIASRLGLGQALDDEEIAALQQEDDANRAQERALRLLEHRPRTRAELVQRLRRAGYADEAIDQALERLERVGLVDDEAFARFWVEQRLAFRPRGRRALRYELRQRGVANHIISRVLENVSDSEAAAAFVQRYLAKPRETPSEETRDRLLSLLRNRGFDYHTAKEALEELLLAGDSSAVPDNPYESE